MASITVSNGMSLSRSIARRAAMSTFTSLPPGLRSGAGSTPIDGLRVGLAGASVPVGAVLRSLGLLQQPQLLGGRLPELHLYHGPVHVRVAQPAKPALDEQVHGLVVGGADSTIDRAAIPKPGLDQPRP